MTAAGRRWGFALRRRRGFALLHVVQQGVQTLALALFALALGVRDHIRHQVVERIVRRWTPRAWVPAHSSPPARAGRMTAWPCGSGWWPWARSRTRPHRRTDRGNRQVLCPRLASRQLFSWARPWLTRSSLHSCCGLHARPASPAAASARPGAAAGSARAAGCGARLRLVLAAGGPAARARRVLRPAAASSAAPPGRRGQWHDRGRSGHPRRRKRHLLDLLPEFAVGTSRASRTRVRRATSAWVVRRGTGGDATRKHQHRPQDQPSPPPFARRFGQAEGPHEHGVARRRAGALGVWASDRLEPRRAF